MCVAGGRRCPGSSTPSAKQRAKRKANRAYRIAVADEIEKTTGDAELAAKVREIPITDVADVVAVARLDAQAIAKAAGQATYTDKDGHSTTVDVEPAGTTRRTPISEDTKHLLADLDDKVGAFEPDTEFHQALISGDRKRQDELRAEAAEDIAAAEKEYGNTSLPDLKDHELDEAVEKYQKLVDEAYACTDDRVVQAKAEEMLRVTKDVQKYRNAEHHGHPLTYLNDPTQLDDLTPATDEDSARKLAQDMYDRLEHLDPAELSDADLQELHDKWDELDESIRRHTDDISAHETTGNAGIGLVEEIEFRNQPPEEKYEFGDDYQRVRALEEWAAENPTHPAASTIEGNPTDKELSQAARWARGVFDEDKPEASEIDKGIARTVFAAEDTRFVEAHREAIHAADYGTDTLSYMDTLEELRDSINDGTLPYEDSAALDRELDQLRAKQYAHYGADPEANADKVVDHIFHGKNLDDMHVSDVKALHKEYFNKTFFGPDADPLAEDNDTPALARYAAMRSKLEEFNKAVEGVEDDQPTSARDAADMHWRCMEYGKEVFAATKDPYARKKVLDTAALTRKRARRMARSARDLHDIPRDCWPNNIENREINPGFYAKHINDFEFLSRTNSPNLLPYGVDTPWGKYSLRGNNIDEQAVFVSTAKSGASSVIRIAQPEYTEDTNPQARGAFFFHELTRAQREVETTGKRDVNTDNRAGYASFDRVFTAMDAQRKDNEVADALCGVAFHMSSRSGNTAYESDRNAWRESASTLRKAVGSQPFDNEEDNATFDRMCREAADTYDYEVDRLEKIRRGH